MRDSSPSWDSKLALIVNGVVTFGCTEVFSEVGAGSKTSPNLLLVSVLLHVHLGLIALILPLLLGIIVVLGLCDLTVSLDGKSVALVSTLCPHQLFKLNFVILVVGKLRWSCAEPSILLLVI